MNCACVKSSFACTNCLPHRKGKCANQAARAPDRQGGTPPRRSDTPTADVEGSVSNAVERINGMTVSDNPILLQESSISLLDNHSMEVASQTPLTSNDVGNPPSIARHSPSSNETHNTTDALPPFTPHSSTPFQWGEVPGHIFCDDIASVYEEQVTWRKNIFSAPTGHAGTEYIKEHTRLLRAYKDKTPLERVALGAIMVMPGLLLQKPHAKAGSKDFSKHLSRRLTLWKAGKIRELLEEARTIQSRLPEHDSRNGLTSHKLNRRFAALVSKGNIHAAISLITEYNKGGVLDLTPEVRSALKVKHPKAQSAIPEAMLQGELPAVNPILFECITSDTIRRSALATQGAAGPSMADSYIWRRMLVSFKAASNNLCCAVAGVTRRLATEHVDPLGLTALLNNRLIPLDKNPGVRPIGIGETLRRIIGKSVMMVLKKDIMHAAGVAQVCAGHPAGCEAAIHALRNVFTAMETDAVLLVDADNAFNSLNRAVALHNIQYTCPPLATIVINFYRSSSRLFVTGGMELSSEEGTTQGCPLSMALYAISVVPLINKCRNTATSGCVAATQVWFADDAAAGGHLKALHQFWNLLVRHGPAYGYFPKPSKSYLVTKSGHYDEAQHIFSDTGVQFTNDDPDLKYKAGQRHLGAAVGSDEFVAAYLEEKVASWTEQVIQLTDIASTQPHAAYAAFVFGLRHRWTFVQRTMPTAGDHMQPLKDAIRSKLIPTLTKHELNDLEMELMTLPARYGGMSFDDPEADSQWKHSDSLECTATLTGLILDGESELPRNMDLDQEAKTAIKIRHRTILKTKADDLQSRLPEPQRRAMELAREKGGSSTLTTIPISEHGFFFEVKSDFHDHVHLRYCWPLENLPPTCPCGSRFTIDHAQICKLSGFIHMRHDDPTTFLAKCMREVHHDVELEPPLQPLTGETLRHQTANTEPDARADIRVRGFWTDGRNAFFDTRVFYPHAPSYRSRSLQSLYRKFESDKKREYSERINTVEHGSFTPLVFSACGGMGREATVAVKKLATALATKRNENYCHVISWMRCCLSFSLARSAIRCVRGSRSLRRKTRLYMDGHGLAPVDLVDAEAHLDLA